MNVEVIGVHPVEEAKEPCYLVEVAITGDGEFDVGAITQPDDSLPKSNWQVPYDEFRLSTDGTSGVELDFGSVGIDGSLRVAFFFHVLNLQEPLHTPAGPVPLPHPSPRPARLSFMAYEEPC